MSLGMTASEWTPLLTHREQAHLVHRIIARDISRDAVLSIDLDQSKKQIEKEKSARIASMIVAQHELDEGINEARMIFETSVLQTDQDHFVRDTSFPYDPGGQVSLSEIVKHYSSRRLRRSRRVFIDVCSVFFFDFRRNA